MIGEGQRPAPSSSISSLHPDRCHHPGRLLTSPLRDRFGIVQRLEFCNVKDLTDIVSRSARCLGLDMTEDGARGSPSLPGTPRIANRLLRRVRILPR